MPEFAHQNKEHKMGASIDAIISSDLGINITDPITQEDYTFNGDGILEIKTDFYHMDKVREEWVIQVHHQMICSGYNWGIVAVLNQKGHLKIYPVPRNEELIDKIIFKHGKNDKWRIELSNTNGNFMIDKEVTFSADFTRETFSINS